MKKPERQTYFLAIVSLQLSGSTEGSISPGEGVVSLFIRLNEYRSPCCRCQGGSAEIISPNYEQDCNLKIHNALRRIFREQKSAAAASQILENRENWGTRFGENELLL